MKEKICIVAEMEDIKIIDEIAKIEERPRSFVIRSALKKFVESKNATTKKN